MTPSRPLTPSPQPLSRRERGFCDTLFEGEGGPEFREVGSDFRTVPKLGERLGRLGGDEDELRVAYHRVPAYPLQHADPSQVRDGPMAFAGLLSLGLMGLDPAIAALQAEFDALTLGADGFEPDPGDFTG